MLSHSCLESNGCPSHRVLLAFSSEEEGGEIDIDRIHFFLFLQVDRVSSGLLVVFLYEVRRILNERSRDLAIAVLGKDISVVELIDELLRNIVHQFQLLLPEF